MAGSTEMDGDVDASDVGSWRQERPSLPTKIRLGSSFWFAANHTANQGLSIRKTYLAFLSMNKKALLSFVLSNLVGRLPSKPGMLVL